jgi:hypothetical protein
MSKSKPTTKPAAAQAPISRISDRPLCHLTPKQARFYFELLEAVVALYFGGKAMDYLQSFSRSKARKAKTAWSMRTMTLMAVIRRLLEEKGRLYPHNQKQSAKAA